ncbi:hypothetical protein DdX_15175 [Ditylenchus destructor]|uniref:Uncharacterized protein n=1 Tax=Ditylenchus destructor TaxID=166010 RepID=A0AAD4MT77_9BILA|nr:hypothetical protein DdX_15175 [Ditylenchus destructor]
MMAGAAAHLHYNKRKAPVSSAARKKTQKSPQTVRKRPTPATSHRHSSVLSLLPLPMAPRAASLSAGSGANSGPEAISLLLQNRSISPSPYLIGLFGHNSGVTGPMTAEQAAQALLEARKRSGSVPGVKFTLSVAWHLKADHVRALKVTWSRLCDTPRANCRGILGIMERVFEKFEAKDKTLKDVFYRSAFVEGMADCTEVAKRHPQRRNARRHSDIGLSTMCSEYRENKQLNKECVANPNSIATLRDHIHFFVSLISQVVQSLEKSPQEIFDHIDRIGCYHAHLKRYGFRANMWDKLGVCLIDGIVVQDCLRGFPDACRAWTIMVAALIDRLRSAPRNFMPLPLLNFRHRGSRPMLLPPVPAEGNLARLVCPNGRRESQMSRSQVLFTLQSEDCPDDDAQDLTLNGPPQNGGKGQENSVSGAESHHRYSLGVAEMPPPTTMSAALAALGRQHQKRLSDANSACNQRSQSHQRFQCLDQLAHLTLDSKNSDGKNYSNGKISGAAHFRLAVNQNSISQQNFTHQTTFV